LKSEWWGAPLFQGEKYQGKETYDKRLLLLLLSSSSSSSSSLTYHRVFVPWYVSGASGVPHRSGFRFQTVALSL
jgi:hypothetical protein